MQGPVERSHEHLFENGMTEDEMVHWVFLLRRSRNLVREYTSVADVSGVPTAHVPLGGCSSASPPEHPESSSFLGV